MGIKNIADYRRELALHLDPADETKSSILQIQYLNEKQAIRNLVINKNSQGEYSLQISELDILNYSHQVFYDAQEKVFEFVCINKELVIQVHTSKQLNLYGDFKLKKLTLESQAAVCFIGQLFIELGIKAKAKALAFKEYVQAPSCHLECQYAIVFQNRVLAQDLNVTAGSIYQCQDVSAENSRFSCLNFYQQAPSKLLSNHMILVAQHAVCEGSMQAHQSLFLASETLTLAAQAQWQVPSEHHFHCVHLKLDEQAVMNFASSKHDATQVIIDGGIYIAKLASLKLNKTIMTADFIENHGRLILDACSVKTKQLSQLGHLSICRAEIYLEQLLYQATEDKTSVHDSFIHVAEICIESGECHFVSGSKLHCLQKFFTSSAAHVFIEASTCVVDGLMQLTGPMMASKSTNISAFSLHSVQELKLHQASLQLTDVSYIFNKLYMYEAELKADYLEILDECQIRHSLLRATELMMKLNTQSYFEYVSFENKRLSFEGPKAEYIKCQDCHFLAHEYSIQNLIHFEYSNLIGIDDEKAQHVFIGELRLDKSFFFTESTIQQTAGLVLENGSAITVGEHIQYKPLKVDNAHIFAKKMKSYSEIKADYMHLNVSEELIAHHQMLLDNCSSLTSKQLVLEQQSSLKIQHQSQVQASESISSKAGSQITSHESVMMSEEMIFDGSVAIVRGVLNAKELGIYSQFLMEQESIMQIQGKCVAGFDAELNMDNSRIHAKKLFSYGQAVFAHSNCQTEETLGFGPSAYTKIIGRSLLDAADIYNAGHFYMHKQDNKQGFIKAKNSLTFADTAKIHGDKLVVQSNHLHNHGLVRLTESFIGKGRYFDNFGDISATSAYYGFDALTFNMGRLSSDTCIINSNYFNFLGGTYAKKSLTSNGLINLNLGWNCANNYTNYSLLSFNFGFVTPNLNAEYSDICSVQNAVNTVSNTMGMIAPGYAQGIGLTSTLVNTASAAYGIYKEASQLRWDQLENMQLHELYPLMGKIKSQCQIAYSAYANIAGLRAEANNWKDSFTMAYNKCDQFYEASRASFAKIDWKQIGLSASSSLFGSYNDNSIIHVNAGVSFMPNTSKWNWVHVNQGLEKSALTHTINTQHLHNEGHSSGSQSSFIFHDLKNSGHLSGQFKMMLKGKQALNIGTIDGHHGLLDITDLKQEGDMHLSKSCIKVKKFEDTVGANTDLQDSFIQAETVDQHGYFDFNKVSVKASEHYHSDKQAKSDLDNVCIETKDFEYDGHLEYQHGCTIIAETLKIDKDAVVHGAQTDKDKLFKDKPEEKTDAKPEEKTDAKPEEKTDAKPEEKTDAKPEEKTDAKPEEKTDAKPEEKTDAKPEEKTEPKKEFCPQHVLNLFAKHSVLNGKMTGGDYTHMAGNPKAAAGDADYKSEDILIGDHAQIDLEYGSILTKKMQTKGVGHFDKFNVEIGEHHIDETADYKFTSGYYQGDILDDQGRFCGDNSYFKVADVHFGDQAKEHMMNTYFESQHIRDEGDLTTSGQVVFITDRYEHSGHVHSEKPSDPKLKNLFYVKAKTADLTGTSDLDNAYYAIDNFSDAMAFAAGQGRYSAYVVTDSFSMSTTGHIDINQEIARNCHMYLQADSIDMRQNYNKNYNLNLVSNLGDVNLLADVHAQNFYVQSAGKIRTNRHLDASEVLAFEAKDAVENYGGILNAKTTSVTAASIKNITAGSAAAANGTPIAVGNAGVINASENTYLTAVSGNIENHGGLIRGGVYTQLVAKNDVLNQCNVRTYQGQYDVVKVFDPGVIQGGSGQGDDKIGLYIKADGRVVGNASNFVSTGTNYIQGVKGIDLGYQSHTYVSYQKYEHTFINYSEKLIINTSTNLKGCDIVSSNGRNILISDEGEVNSTASNMLSKGGNDIYAKKDVNLRSAIYSDKHYEYSSRFWKVFQKKKQEAIQQSAPTLIYDNGSSRIRSVEGCVDARGAYFIGSGDLSIEAHGPIKLGRDVLNQTREESSRSCNWSVTGLDAVKAMLNGGNLWDALTAEDATLAKLNSLMGSQGAADLLANTANLGIDLSNTSNSICRAVGSGHITEELMSRYGLGGANGFSPSLNVGIQQSQTSSEQQGLGKGGIDRGGNVSLKSDTSIEVYNGAPIHAGKDLNLDAPKFVAHAAELHSKFSQNTQGLSFHLNLHGVQSVSGSESHKQQETTHYEYSSISAGGTTYIHHGEEAMNTMELDGAKINTQHIEGGVDTLIITDKQDCTKSYAHSVSASSTGQFSVQHSQGSSKLTKEHSGIHTRADLNSDEHHFAVGHTVMTGGAITSDGVNHFQSNTLESHSLHDSKQEIGIGFSGNYHHFEGKDTPEANNHVGEKAIQHFGNVKLQYTDYAAEQASVVYGQSGNDLHIYEYMGDEIHTSSQDGKTISHDIHQKLNVEIPIINKSHIDTMKSNVQRFFDTVHPPQPNPKSDHEPALANSRRHQDKLHATPVAAAGPHPQDPKKMIEQALKHVHIDSKLAERAQRELKRNGQLSAATETALKKHVVDALIKTTKAGTELVWDKLTEKVVSDMINHSEHWISRVHLGTKGAIFQFQFNYFLSDREDGLAKAKHAVAQTTTDMVLSMVLNKTPGVGWVLTAAGIMDSFYSEDELQRLTEKGANLNAEAVKAMQDGDIFLGIALANQSESALTAAGAMHFIHQLAGLTDPIVKKIEDLFADEPAAAHLPKPI